MKWQTRHLVLAALAVALLASPLAAQGPSAAPDKDKVNRISERLICQCGCHYLLRHCPHLECPSAPALRAALREKLAAGQSEEQALKAIVADLGPAVLSAPPAEGFNLAAWVMPFVALLAGLVAALLVLRRWRNQPAAAPDPALLGRYRQRLEQEIKRAEES